MQTLNIKVFNDDEFIEEKTNIDYTDKLNTIYFTKDNIKYYLNYKNQTFKYVTKEEKVTLNFLTNTVDITLLNNKYSLNMTIIKNKFINNFKEYIIEYILKEDMIKRTIIITLN